MSAETQFCSPYMVDDCRRNSGVCFVHSQVFQGPARRA
jgi:hypothetical protein